MKIELKPEEIDDLNALKRLYTEKSDKDESLGLYERFYPPKTRKIMHTLSETSKVYSEISSFIKNPEISSNKLLKYLIDSWLERLVEAEKIIVEEEQICGKKGPQRMPKTLHPS